jgi:YidC/Oxa1 family membrane protein insertase
MLSNIWNAVLYKPLLNALAFLVSIVPGGDIGVAVIVLTIFVKVVLFPFSQRLIESQTKMNLMAPELKKIKESGASKEEQAKQTFELYKHHKTNPFSGCLLVFIQIPIIFALYYVFMKGINLDSALLYPFIKVPEHINLIFLGILDVSKNGSIVLALLAGISQYLQAYLMPKPAVSNTGSNSFQDNMTKSMQTQMKYILPIFIAFIAYRVSGAVALYWITSNIFAIGQQIYANHKKQNQTMPVVIK